MYRPEPVIASTCDSSFRVTSTTIDGDLAGRVTIHPDHMRGLIEKLQKVLDKIEEDED